MANKRLLRSPLLVMLTGLCGGAFALALLSDAEFTAIDFGRAVVVGALASAVAALTAGLQRRGLSHEHRTLSQAQHDAKHDPLTGLANRTELYHQLQVSLDEARAQHTVFGVVFLDLDRFKVINDTLGHDAGDELLRIVAERLRAATRSSDVVARLGGDEFVLICRGFLPGDSVLAVVHQVLRRFTEPIQLYGRQQVVSTSVGVAIAGAGDARTPDELVRDADSAMYKAKRERSGYAVFDDLQRTLVSDRMAIERDLDRAFQSQELVVYYQPIVDTAQQRLHGFEAFIRWDHPERGLLPPSDFVPAAQEAGLPARLGELVLREACAQAALWGHLHPGASKLQISVNVSEQQLFDTSFPYLVDDVLRWSGLGPGQLLLEVTEEGMVPHLDGQTTLRQLREMGVSLAIDDFGTGQSSLSYLKQFTVASALKIDQSFVREMHGGRADEAIVEAIVTMAAGLGLSVVAQGVEREEDVQRLAALGVHLMQGDLFNRPASADTIGDLTAMLDFAPSRAGARLHPVAISQALVHSIEIGPTSEL